VSNTRLVDVLLPSDTHANRPAAPPKGSVFPCTTHNKLEQYNSSGTWVDWATLGGSGGLTQSYLGKNAAGASTEGFATTRNLLKKITLATAGMIGSVDVYIKDNGSVGVGALCANVYSDNAGAPARTVAVGTGTMNAVLNTLAIDSTARWLSFAIGAWLPAGDYWISIGCVDAGTYLIHYDTGGSDKYYDSSGSWVQDPVTSSVSSTTKDYSIRANIVR
jgi:hypothetical protein